MDRGLLSILGLFSFGLGACIASFLNVVIWRVPRGESIVSPPSHCPKCNALIKWYQNIPILSWLALRGKCANCKAPISPRYILIEALGGVLFLAAFVKYGHLSKMYVDPWATLILAWVWISLMIVVVAASGGYPESYEKGFEIKGLDACDHLVFHAGTKMTEDGKIVTSGGRVLCVYGEGKTLDEAIDSAYEGLAPITFDKMHFRKDIGRTLGK